jgi:lipopolysaccharide/colanic/teichoic acid biosynthesis glycosyltransferase
VNERELIDYWSQAATPLGRGRMGFRVWRKRVLWAVTVNSARFVKRAGDLIVSGFALLGLLPVFVVTALAIKLEDGGPIFFQQQRVGLGGRLFGMWKFRSMVPNADKLKDQLLQQN